MLLVLFPGLLALAVVLEQGLLRPRVAARTPVEQVVFWERHAARNPGFAPSHARLGQAYEAVRDLEGAARAYRRALELDGDLGAAAVGLAAVLAQSGRRAEAVREMEDFFARNPDCRPCALRLTDDLLALDRVAEARAAIETVIGAPGRATLYATTPDFDPATALVLAGRVHQRLGDPEQALRYLDQALQRAPAHPAAHLHAARLRLESEPEAAVTHLERYLAGFPGDLRAGLWLGHAHAHAGRTDRARAVWRETRRRSESRSDPNAERIRARLDALLEGRAAAPSDL